MKVYSNYIKHNACYKTADVCDDLDWNEEFNKDYSKNPIELWDFVSDGKNDPKLKEFTKKKYLNPFFEFKLKQPLKVTFDSDRAVFEFESDNNKAVIKRIKTILKQKTIPEIIKLITLDSSEDYTSVKRVEWKGNEYKAGMWVKFESFISLDPNIYE